MTNILKALGDEMAAIFGGPVRDHTFNATQGKHPDAGRLTYRSSDQDDTERDLASFCDVCDALLTPEEESAGVRWGQCLCDDCNAGYCAANPEHEDGK